MDDAEKSIYGGFSISNKESVVKIKFGANG